MLTRRVVVKSIIIRAIDFEEVALNFYEDLQQKVSDPEVEEILGRLAGEERKHKSKLQNLLDGGYEEVIESNENDSEVIPDLPEDSADVKDAADLSMAEALEIARRREIISYRFYRAMARSTGILVARRIFFYLATDEMRHLKLVDEMKKKLVPGESGE